MAPTHRLPALALACCLLAVAWPAVAGNEQPAAPPGAGGPPSAENADGVAGPPSAPPLNGWEERAKALASFNETLSAWDKPVEFWGKVIDQFGNPVEGVELIAQVPTQRYIPTAKGGFRTSTGLKAVSAADGSFHFAGAEGFSLSIKSITKAGYAMPIRVQLEKPELAYHYCYTNHGTREPLFTPDPARPEIIRLWKMKDPGPRHTLGLYKYLKFDEPAKPVDLDKRRQEEAGKFDFTVQARKAQDGEGEVVELVFQAKDGGFALPAPDDAFLFTAPAEGYQPTLVVRLDDPVTRKRFSAGERVPFALFVQTRGGRCHSVVAGHWVKFMDKTNVDAYVLTNPTGGLDLEVDLANQDMAMCVYRLPE